MSLLIHVFNVQLLKVLLSLRIKEVDMKTDAKDIAPKKTFMTFKEKKKNLSRMQRKVNASLIESFRVNFCFCHLIVLFSWTVEESRGEAGERTSRSRSIRESRQKDQTGEQMIWDQCVLRWCHVFLKSLSRFCFPAHRDAEHRVSHLLQDPEESSEVCFTARCFRGSGKVRETERFLL